MGSGLAVGVQLLVGKQLLDAVFGAVDAGDDLGSVAPEIVLVLVATLFLVVVTALQSEQQRVVAELVSRHVEQELLTVAVSVDLEAYETPAFFDRLQRAQMAGQSRPWQMTMGLLSFVSNAVAVGGIAIALLTIQPLLLPLIAVSSIPLLVATVRNSRSSHRFAYDITTVDRERRYLSHVLAGREFAKEVRVFDLAPLLRTRYDALYDHRVDALRALVRARLRRLIPAGILAAGLVALTLGALVALVLEGRMDLAGATVAAVGVQQLSVRLRTIYGSAGSLFEGSLFLDDFNSFTELAPVVESHRPTGHPPQGFSTLRVDRVSFSYPGASRCALSEVSLTIDRGEVIALVGQNGSGKSTLAKLLCQLYHPTSGAILWDGVDLASCDPRETRQWVSGLFQDFSQYHLSAHENIVVGRYEREADAEAAVTAARRAGAHEFIAGLDEGYATRLGRQFEGGRELSTGQWQRLALARAFFRDAPFLVLDEPTSALDPAAERDLFDRIRDLARDNAVVLISHRFSSVRSADRIYVLDSGRIAEVGTHEELMSAGGQYAQMFRIQASAYAELRPVPPA